MIAKEWAVPLVLGLVVAAGLWTLGAPDGAEDGHGSRDGQSATTTGTHGPTGPPDVLVPFDRALAVEGSDITFLVLAPKGRAALEGNLTGRDAAFDPSVFEWQGDHVAFLGVAATSSTACASTPCAGASHAPDWPLPVLGSVPAGHAPLLLRDGYNATKVTAYIVNETGHLLGSNANDTSRFTKHPDYFRLQSSAWYLGEASTAPNGTAHLPGFAQPLIDRVRPQLDGLPEGGVASVRSNAYVALYGTLFVTIRVDELVHAP